MTAANDHLVSTISAMTPAQLRSFVAQAAGLHAHQEGAAATRAFMARVAAAIPEDRPQASPRPRDHAKGTQG